MKCGARSTAEAEFRSMASGLCEVMWLKILLTEIQLYMIELHLNFIVIIKLLSIWLTTLSIMTEQNM